MRSSPPSRWYLVTATAMTPRTIPGQRGHRAGKQADVRATALACLMAGQAKNEHDDQQSEDSATEGDRGERVQAEDLLLRLAWPACSRWWPGAVAVRLGLGARGNGGRLRGHWRAPRRAG